MNIEIYTLRIVNKTLSKYRYTKKPNYIKKECLSNKKLLIYYLNKRLIFKFNIINIKKKEILIEKYFLINIIINTKRQNIIQESIKII